MSPHPPSSLESGRAAGAPAPPVGVAHADTAAAPASPLAARLSRLIPPLCAATALAVTAAAWHFAVQPALSQRAGAAAVQQSLDEARLTYDRLNRALRADRHRAIALRLQLAEQNTPLGRADQLNPRIGLLLARAEAAGAPIDQVRPGAPVSGEWFAHLPLTLTTRTTFPQAVRLAERLHADFEDTQICGIRIRAAGSPDPAAAPGAPERVDTTLELDWFTALDTAAPETPRP